MKKFLTFVGAVMVFGAFTTLTSCHKVSTDTNKSTQDSICKVDTTSVDSIVVDTVH